MKKVCIVCSEFGKDKGGIQNWIYNIYKLLEMNKCKVDVYAYKEDKFKIFPFFKKRDIYILSTWKMCVFVFFHMIFLKKANFYILVHGNELLDTNIFFKKLLTFISKINNVKFIANSKAIGEIFYKEVGKKIDFIQNPFIDFNEFEYLKNNVSVKIKANNSIPIFYTISRLVKRKNIENVIRAFYELYKEGFEFKYYIAGEGPEYENIKFLINKLHLDKNIIMLGKVDEKTKIRYFMESDYFLLPSIFDEKGGSIEGYGIVFIEANYFKLPVLSGNTGGMKEAVINNVTGLHTNGTIDDIKRNIKDIIEKKWDKEKIKEHALRHDIHKQTLFLTFLGCLNE